MRNTYKPILACWLLLATPLSFADGLSVTIIKQRSEPIKVGYTDITQNEQTLDLARGKLYHIQVTKHDPFAGLDKLLNNSKKYQDSLGCNVSMPKDKKFDQVNIYIKGVDDNLICERWLHIKDALSGHDWTQIE